MCRVISLRRLKEGNASWRCHCFLPHLRVAQVVIYEPRQPLLLSIVLDLRSSCGVSSEGGGGRGETATARRPVKSHKVQMLPRGIIKQQKAAIKRHKHVRNTNTELEGWVRMRMRILMPRWLKWRPGNRYAIKWSTVGAGPARCEPCRQIRYQCKHQSSWQITHT